MDAYPFEEPHDEKKPAAPDDQAGDALVEGIVNNLFTSGFGETAHRLVLESKPEEEGGRTRTFGGWSRMAVASVIRAHLAGDFGERQACAELVRAAGCSGCTVLRPFLTRPRPAGPPEEHDPRCPVFLADAILNRGGA